VHDRVGGWVGGIWLLTTSSIMLLVPLSNLPISNTPMGPFQMMVLEVMIACAAAARVTPAAAYAPEPRRRRRVPLRIVATKERGCVLPRETWGPACAKWQPPEPAIDEGETSRILSNRVDTVGHRRRPTGEHSPRNQWLGCEVGRVFGSSGIRL
jgi:hypothetical protein